jgi:hypothetical protein
MVVISAGLFVQVRQDAVKGLIRESSVRHSSHFDLIDV